MDEKLKRIESRYWKIAKIVSVLFVIINYQMWTAPYSFVKVVLLIIGVAVGIFVAINILDILVGMIVGLIKHIHRRIKDRRLLKRFCQTKATEDNNAVK